MIFKNAYTILAAFALASIASPALAQSTEMPDLTEFGFSVEDIESLRRQAQESFENGEVPGGPMVRDDANVSATAGDSGGYFSDDVLGMMKSRAVPNGCLSPANPNYTAPEPGSRCDTSTQVFIDAEAMLESLLPGEYDGRLYEFSRDCTIAATYQIYRQTGSVDSPGMKFDAFAQGEMRFWQRVFVRVVGARNAYTITADMDRPDTRFAQPFGKDNGEDFDFSDHTRPHYNQCVTVRSKIGGTDGIIFTTDNSDPRCLPGQMTGMLSCPVDCNLEADTLVCPMEQ